MGKTVIVSEDTVRDLIEAHASLCAWYYSLTKALRSSGGVPATPTDEERRAFVERIGKDFPEIAEVVSTVGVPRPFVPPPPPSAETPQRPAEVTTVLEPAQQRFREKQGSEK